LRLRTVLPPKRPNLAGILDGTTISGKNTTISSRFGAKPRERFFIAALRQSDGREPMSIITVRPGETVTVVGIGPGPVDPGYFPPGVGPGQPGGPPNWSPIHPSHPIANPWPPYVDAGPPGPQPPWPGSPPNWSPIHPSHPIANPWPPYVDAGPPGPQPPTGSRPPQGGMPGQLPGSDPGGSGWVWAYVPGYGWMWAQVPQPPSSTTPPPSTGIEDPAPAHPIQPTEPEPK
jgi:hypothetical protein